jgi:hypothetical protein
MSLSPTIAVGLFSGEVTIEKDSTFFSMDVSLCGK